MVGSCLTSLLPPNLLTKRLCSSPDSPALLSLQATSCLRRAVKVSCSPMHPLGSREPSHLSASPTPSSLPPGLSQAVLFWTSRLPGSASQNPALLQRLSAQSICLFLDAFSGHLPPCSSSCDSCGLGLSSRYGRPLGTVVLNTHASPWRREVR